MLMPDKFWEWLLQISTSKSNCLFVSHLFKRPFYIGDFIYAANSEVFLNFIQLIVNYKSTVIHPSIAFDLKHPSQATLHCIHKRAEGQASV